MSEILNAEGDKAAIILRATADKEAQIAIATGEAEALRLVYEAQAKGIRYINEAAPSQSYISLEGFKALEKLGESSSTKIVIPTELQGLAGLATVLPEIAKNDDK